jgi:hypothetical protein
VTHHRQEHTSEAKAKREQRKALRRLPCDPLQERARIALFWKKCNETNKHYGLVHARAFFRNTSFQRHLLPKVREHIQAKQQAARRQYLDELRDHGQRAAHAKALAKAGPMPLFDEIAA